MKFTRFLYFHNFIAEAELISAHLATGGLSKVAPSAPCLPLQREAANSFDGVLISRLAVKSWYDFEATFSFNLEVPRFVTSSPRRPWTKEMCHSSGFDGWIPLDLALPPRQIMFNANQVLRDSAKVARSARGRVSKPTNLPLEIDLTVADEINLGILRLLAFGLSDRDIASALQLSPGTIRNRISHMLRSNGFDNRTSLTLYFLRLHRLRCLHEAQIASPKSPIT